MAAFIGDTFFVFSDKLISIQGNEGLTVSKYTNKYHFARRD